LEHDGRQQSQNRDAQPCVPEDVDAVHCGPEDDPDDDPLELPELLDPELLDPPDEVLDPLELLDPDDVLEPLEEPLELAEEPLDVLNPLLEPPLLPLLLPLLLLECPESECPASNAPALASERTSAFEPASALGPPSSPGLPVSDVPHADATPALNPTRQTTRKIRGMPVVEVSRSGFEHGGRARILDIVGLDEGKQPKERRPPPTAKAHILARAWPKSGQILDSTVRLQSRNLLSSILQRARCSRYVHEREKEYAHGLSSTSTSTRHRVLFLLLAARARQGVLVLVLAPVHVHGPTCSFTHFFSTCKQPKCARLA
jgi:hypothetical protein